MRTVQQLNNCAHILGEIAGGELNQNQSTQTNQTYAKIYLKEN